MNPMIGQAIVIAVLAVILFFSGRSTIRHFRAELQGKCSCAGCSGCDSCGKSGAECCACMQHMEKLKKLQEEKAKCCH